MCAFCSRSNSSVIIAVLVCLHLFFPVQQGLKAPPVSACNVYENYREVHSSGGTSVSLDGFISVVTLDTAFTSSYKYKSLALLGQR